MTTSSSSCSSSSSLSMTSTEVVQRSLFAFLESRGLEMQEDAIDDIVLSYVVSIVEELTTSEVADRDAGAFDLDALVEMLEAFLPQTKDVPANEITGWMFSVAEELQSREKRELKFEFDLKSVIEETTSKAKTRTTKISESSDGDFKSCQRRIERLSETSDGGSEGSSLDGDDYHQTLRHLQEMFPYSCSLEVNHCLHLMAGDVERAAQLIMFRHEAGQSLKPSDRKLYKTNTDVDDKVVKERIIGKYGFVDQDDDARYHRPIIKKADDKKMIRYRDGKIVSTKGERFTQVSKQESEEMKKALVNICPN